MSIQTITHRLIQSGKYLEFYEYTKPIKTGYTRRDTNRRFNSHAKPTLPRDHQNERTRGDNVSRTRKEIRRLINSNPSLSKFITLTFATEVKHLCQANRLFKTFIQRLKYVFPGVQYLSVPEFTKKGRVHYHLLSDLPYVENAQLAEIWGNGFVKINHLNFEHDNSNIGAYVSKYIGKEILEGVNKGKKKFFTSRNLNRPVVVDNFEALSELAKHISNNAVLTFEIPILTEYQGVILYKAYELRSRTRSK